MKNLLIAINKELGIDNLIAYLYACIPLCINVRIILVCMDLW